MENILTQEGIWEDFSRKKRSFFQNVFEKESARLDYIDKIILDTQPRTYDEIGITDKMRMEQWARRREIRKYGHQMYQESMPMDKIKYPVRKDPIRNSPGRAVRKPSLPLGDGPWLGSLLLQELDENVDFEKEFIPSMQGRGTGGAHGGVFDSATGELIDLHTSNLDDEIAHIRSQVSSKQLDSVEATRRIEKLRAAKWDRSSTVISEVADSDAWNQVYDKTLSKNEQIAVDRWKRSLEPDVASMWEEKIKNLSPESKKEILARSRGEWVAGKDFVLRPGEILDDVIDDMVPRSGLPMTPAEYAVREGGYSLRKIPDVSKVLEKDIENSAMAKELARKHINTRAFVTEKNLLKMGVTEAELGRLPLIRAATDKSEAVRMLYVTGRPDQMKVTGGVKTAKLLSEQGGFFESILPGERGAPAAFSLLDLEDAYGIDAHIGRAGPNGPTLRQRYPEYRRGQIVGRGYRNKLVQGGRKDASASLLISGKPRQAAIRRKAGRVAMERIRMNKSLFPNQPGALGIKEGLRALERRATTEMLEKKVTRDYSRYLSNLKDVGTSSKRWFSKTISKNKIGIALGAIIVGAMLMKGKERQPDLKPEDSIDSSLYGGAVGNLMSPEGMEEEDSRERMMDGVYDSGMPTSYSARIEDPNSVLTNIRIKSGTKRNMDYGAVGRALGLMASEVSGSELGNVNVRVEDDSKKMNKQYLDRKIARLI